MQEIQSKVGKFVEKLGLDMPLQSWYNDLISEVGELGKEFNKGSGYGEKEFEMPDNFKMELGDILYSLIGLANNAGIDLQSCLEKVIEKYESRQVKRGTIGSLS